MGKILNDVIKAEGQGSKPGKRPGLNPKEAEANLRKLQSEDYSDLEFYDAFSILTYGRSVRNIANKVGLDKSYVNRLQLRTATPTCEVMEKIAQAFNKKPSYFLEYRKAAIIIALDKLLSQSPETATNLYVKIMDAR
jgi:transcriptional regulator with XRE-family HTH domain